MKKAGEINKVLKEQKGLINPEKEAYKKIQQVSDDFIKDLNKKLKQMKITAEVFIGGSLAKDTLVKKNKYDIDIFVRFSEKYDEKKLSGLLGRVIGKAKKVHGSRDYYQVVSDNILIEIIPVLKIKSPKDAKNVTDLSYFHVNYLVQKIKKNKKLADEIRLAKTFAFAQNAYGAESYIHGFSGYALELLICHYGSFLKFIEAIANASNSPKDKIIIDDKKFYKSKKHILIELNSSKLISPIILIDPTFKERNAVAGLSKKTFFKFKGICKRFLENPSSEFFEKKSIGEEMIKKFKKELKIIQVKTSKQAGDIAGTKSKKFFEFFMRRLKKEFGIRKANFSYDERKNIARFYLVLDKKRDEVVRGPPVNAPKNLTSFKKAHSDAFIKKGFAYTKLTHNLGFDQWFKKFIKDYKKIIKEMSVKSIEFIN